MKKLIILLSIVLSSCSCLIGQIPPVSLFVDETCGAAMPDIRPMLEWRDNCGIDTVEQTPTPGTWLTERYNTVHIRAIDKFGNYTDALGSVELLDTIPPELIRVDSTLITQVYQNITSLYNTADRLLALNEMWYDNTFPWDDVEFEYIDSLGVVQTLRGIPEELRPTNLYCNYTMVTATPACYAFLGEGSRYTIFVRPGDTFTIPY